MKAESYIKNIEVGGRNFTLQLCSASEQWAMLKLFFKYGLKDALYTMSIGNKELVSSALFGEFASSATEQEQNEVTQKLLGNCILEGNTKPITIDDFQNRMYDYICLHIEALKFNYADFLPLLLSPEEEEPKEETNQDMSQI